MSNKFSINKEPEKITRVISKTYEILKPFFGPTNKQVLHCSSKGQISLLADCSMALRSFDLKDVSSNIMIKLLEHVSAQTVKSVGEGATITVLLTCQLLLSALRFTMGNYNVVKISDGLKQILFFLTSQLFEFSRPISTIFQLQGFAKTTIEKKLSPEVFQLIREATSMLQRDGILLVEDAIIGEHKVENVCGIDLEAGFASSYFVNDLKNFEASYSNPYLLIMDKPLNFDYQIKEIISFIQSENAPLVIITESISEDILSSLILSSIKKKLKVVVVKYRPIKFIKTGILEDLALLAHSSFDAQKRAGGSPSLGRLKQVVVKKNKSTFLFSNFTKIISKRKVNELNRDLLLSETEYERNNIKSRIARLSSNTIKLLIGTFEQHKAYNEKLKIQKFVTCLNGVIEEGCVPGGGYIYLHLRDELHNWGYLNLIGEELYSLQIAIEALTMPALQLAKNAGINLKTFSDAALQCKYPLAYDLVEKRALDAYAYGLLDSSKQSRVSLCNSFTLAALILTSD